MGAPDHPDAPRAAPGEDRSALGRAAAGRFSLHRRLQQRPRAGVGRLARSTAGFGELVGRPLSARVALAARRDAEGTALGRLAVGTPSLLQLAAWWNRVPGHHPGSAGPDAAPPPPVRVTGTAVTKAPAGGALPSSAFPPTRSAPAVPGTRPPAPILPSPASLPPRGLPRAVGRVSAHGAPGTMSQRMTSAPVSVPVPAEVAAVGRVTSERETGGRRRSTADRDRDHPGPPARSPGHPPGSWPAGAARPTGAHPHLAEGPGGRGAPPSARHPGRPAPAGTTTSARGPAGGDAGASGPAGATLATSVAAVLRRRLERSPTDPPVTPRRVMPPSRRVGGSSPATSAAPPLPGLADRRPGQSTSTGQPGPAAARHQPPGGSPPLAPAQRPAGSSHPLAPGPSRYPRDVGRRSGPGALPGRRVPAADGPAGPSRERAGASPAGTVMTGERGVAPGTTRPVGTTRDGVAPRATRPSDGEQVGDERGGLATSQPPTAALSDPSGVRRSPLVEPEQHRSPVAPGGAPAGSGTEAPPDPTRPQADLRRGDAKGSGGWWHRARTSPEGSLQRGTARLARSTGRGLLAPAGRLGSLGSWEGTLRPVTSAYALVAATGLGVSQAVTAGPPTAPARLAGLLRACLALPGSPAHPDGSARRPARPASADRPRPAQSQARAPAASNGAQRPAEVRRSARTLTGPRVGTGRPRGRAHDRRVQTLAGSPLRGPAVTPGSADAPSATRGAGTAGRSRPVTPAARFAAALQRAPADRGVVLPVGLRPLAVALAGPAPVLVRHGPASRAALAAAGRRAATVGRSIHLDDAPERVPAAVIAHELVHVARSSNRPRLFDDPDLDHEEVVARRVGALARRLGGDSRDLPVSAVPEIASLRVGGPQLYAARPARAGGPGRHVGRGAGASAPAAAEAAGTGGSATLQRTAAPGAVSGTRRPGSTISPVRQPGPPDPPGATGPAGSGDGRPAGPTGPGSPTWAQRAGLSPGLASALAATRLPVRRFLAPEAHRAVPGGDARHRATPLRPVSPPTLPVPVAGNPVPARAAGGHPAGIFPLSDPARRPGASPVPSPEPPLPGSSAPLAAETIEWIIEQVEQRILDELDRRGLRYNPGVL